MAQPGRQRYIGYVDGVRDGGIAGWCRPAREPAARVRVSIFEGGQLLGEARADRFRADLLALGGDGYHGFVFPIPPWMQDGKPHAVTLYPGSGGEPLPGSPLEVRVMPPGRPDEGASQRALVVDACTPTPDQDAGSTVCLEHMRILQSLGYHVTFVPETDFAFVPNYTPALQRQGVEAIYAPSFFTIEQFLRERGAEFDLVYLHRYSIAERCLHPLRQYAPQAPVLFNTADLHYLREERGARLTGSALELASARMTRERELAVIAAVDCTLLCNTTEMELVGRALPHSSLYHFPWVMEAVGSPLPRFDEREGFMYLGGFGHPPNADAVEHFVRQVMPSVRTLIPGARFYIYGSNLPASIQALAAPDIIVCGFAPALAPVFDRHRVSIVPLRYGAGFKGKLAASLAHGVPVVASPIGAEGTGLGNGEQVLIAATDATFASALARLYTDRELWERLARAGKQFVEANFSRERGRERFVEILERLARRKPTVIETDGEHASSAQTGGAS